MTTSEPRSSLIDAVKTPLGFLVLGLLVVDGTVASLGLPCTPDLDDNFIDSTLYDGRRCARGVAPRSVARRQTIAGVQR